MGRRSIVAAAVSLALAMAVALTGPRAVADSTSSTAPAAGTGPPTWVIVSGRGFGHGVGMAQDGAYWMSRQGRSSAEILRLFYPGTSLGSRSGDVRVPLAGGGRVVIGLPSGGTVAGRRISNGGSVTVSPEGSGLVATFATFATGAGDAAGAAPALGAAVAAPALAMTPIAFREQTPDAASGDNAPLPTPPLPTPTPPLALPPAGTAPPIVEAVPEPAAAPSPPSSIEPATEPVAPTPTSAVPSTEPGRIVTDGELVVEAAAGTTLLYGGRPYRGRLELRSQGGVRVVNELDVEQYLRGMAEITDSGWPQAALEAQAIAARTYAFRTMASADEVCPTQRCQVYVGAKAEYPAMDKAVAATRGKVVTYAKGKLAVTFYSASGGGTIATPEEAFGGGGDFPYLQAGTYPTGDLKSWVVSLTLNELGRRVGYRGTPFDVVVTKVGPSGRAIDVTVSGSAGTLVVPGPKFDAALGLRSTFFTLQRSATAANSDDVVPLAPSADVGSGVPLEFSQTEVFEARDRDLASADVASTDVASTDVAGDSTIPTVSTATFPTVPAPAPTSLASPIPSGSRVDTSHQAVEMGMIGTLMVVVLGPLAAMRARRQRKRSAR